MGGGGKKGEREEKGGEGREGEGRGGEGERGRGNLMRHELTENRDQAGISLVSDPLPPQIEGEGLVHNPGQK